MWFVVEVTAVEGIRHQGLIPFTIVVLEHTLTLSFQVTSHNHNIFYQQLSIAAGL